GVATGAPSVRLGARAGDRPRRAHARVRWVLVDLDRSGRDAGVCGAEGGVVRPGAGGRPVSRLGRAPVQVVLLDKGKQMKENVAQAGGSSSEGRVRLTAGEKAVARGEGAMLVLAEVGRQPDLTQVVTGLDARRRLADLLDGGQQQPDQHRYDGY